MRISDWSSDVCSSDLRQLPCRCAFARQGLPLDIGRGQRGGTGDHRAQGFDAHHHLGTAMLDRLERRDTAAELLALRDVFDAEIQTLLRAAETLGRQIQTRQRERAGKAIDTDRKSTRLNYSH